MSTTEGWRGSRLTRHLAVRANIANRSDPLADGREGSGMRTWSQWFTAALSWQRLTGGRHTVDFVGSQSNVPSSPGENDRE